MRKHRELAVGGVLGHYIEVAINERSFGIAEDGEGFLLAFGLHVLCRFLHKCLHLIRCMAAFGLGDGDHGEKVCKCENEGYQFAHERSPRV
jgi:hypothetical protein